MNERVYGAWLHNALYKQHHLLGRWRDQHPSEVSEAWCGREMDFAESSLNGTPTATTVVGHVGRPKQCAECREKESEWIDGITSNNTRDG